MDNNNISFTGLTNIASVYFRRPGTKESRNISMRLTDDIISGDLSDFRNVLKKTKGDTSTLINMEYPDIINIEALKIRDNTEALLLNGYVIKPADNTLPMYSYIAKLSRRIAGMKNKDFVVNKDYKEYAAKDILIPGDKNPLAFVPEQDKKMVMDSFFIPENIRRSAKYINQVLSNIMNSYFGV